jgi:ATP-dependent Clp protease ATP-binding subunit ClpA
MNPFTSLTSQATAVLTAAGNELQMMGHTETMPAHVITALLARTNNPAGRLLSQVGMSLRGARELTKSLQEQGDTGRRAGVEPYSQSLTKVLRDAIAIAEKRRGRGTLATTLDLLEAIIYSQDYGVMKILKSQHIDPRVILDGIDPDQAAGER